MSAPTTTIAQAEANSLAARARFMASVEVAKMRLNPATLTHNAVSNVKENVTRNTVDTVRNNPRTAAAIAGAALLFFARKPIARLIRSGSDADDAENNLPVREGSNDESSE